MVTNLDYIKYGVQILSCTWMFTRKVLKRSINSAYYFTSAKLAIVGRRRSAILIFCFVKVQTLLDKLLCKRSCVVKFSFQVLLMFYL